MFHISNINFDIIHTLLCFLQKAKGHNYTHCMVEYVLLGLGEIMNAQELQCSNQLKGEWCTIDDIYLKEIVLLANECERNLV